MNKKYFLFFNIVNQQKYNFNKQPHFLSLTFGSLKSNYTTIIVLLEK